MKIEKILMPTDFSPCSYAALSYAIFLARHYQAELHLLHVVVLHGGLEEDEPTYTFPDTGEILRRYDEVAASEMGRVLEQHATETLSIRERQVRAVSAAPAIVEYAAEQEIDVLVIGTHGRRGLRRFLLGSVAEEVVRSAPCPVITVPSTSDGPVPALERILVPYDFSEDSQAALEIAKHVAASYGSRIEVVHVVAPPAIPGGMAPMPIAGPSFVDLSEQLVQSLDEQIAKVQGPEVQISRQVLFGSVANQIADEAGECQANLIVIGSHGLSGFRRFLLGSVTERVVRSAPCPVLVLRPPAESLESDSDLKLGSAAVRATAEPSGNEAAAR